MNFSMLLTECMRLNLVEPLNAQRVFQGQAKPYTNSPSNEEFELLMRLTMFSPCFSVDVCNFRVTRRLGESCSSGYFETLEN